MLRTPADEARMIDEHLTYINEILTQRMQKRGNFDNEVMRVQEIKKRKEFDKTKMETTSQKVPQRQTICKRTTVGYRSRT